MGLFRETRQFLILSLISRGALDCRRLRAGWREGKRGALYCLVFPLLWNIALVCPNALQSYAPCNCRCIPFNNTHICQFLIMHLISLSWGFCESTRNTNTRMNSFLQLLILFFPPPPSVSLSLLWSVSVNSLLKIHVLILPYMKVPQLNQ